MSFPLCEDCFPSDGREVLTIPAILPCEQCGRYDDRHSGVRLNCYRKDPRDDAQRAKAAAQWPPRLKVDMTPEQVADLYLLAVFKGDAPADAQLKLAELLKLYWRGGYDVGAQGGPRA